MQSPRFLLGLFRLLLAEGRSQCCSLACRFWRIKPLAMAAAMAASRLAHAGRRRDGQGGGRRRDAQPRRGPIPGGAGERVPPPARGAAAAGHPLFPSLPPSGRRELPPPPRVTAWVPRRPSRRAPAQGHLLGRRGLAPSGAERGERHSGQSRAPSGRVESSPAGNVASPGAAPQPRAAARSPAAAIAAAGAATAASSRLPPDDCQVFQKSASGESNLLLRGEL